MAEFDSPEEREELKEILIEVLKEKLAEASRNKEPQ